MSKPFAGKDQTKLLRIFGWVFGIYGVLTAIFFIVFAILLVGTIGGALFFGNKYSEEYECAISEVKKNKDAINLLGEPMEPGLTAYGIRRIRRIRNQSRVKFQTSLTGPKGSGTLYVDYYRGPGGSNFKMSLEKDSAEITLYDGLYPCPKK